MGPRSKKQSEPGPLAEMEVIPLVLDGLTLLILAGVAIFVCAGMNLSMIKAAQTASTTAGKVAVGTHTKADALKVGKDAGEVLYNQIAPGAEWDRAVYSQAAAFGGAKLFHTVYAISYKKMKSQLVMSAALCGIMMADLVCCGAYEFQMCSSGDVFSTISHGVGVALGYDRGNKFIYLYLPAVAMQFFLLIYVMTVLTEKWKNQKQKPVHRRVSDSGSSSDYSYSSYSSTSSDHKDRKRRK